MWYCLFLTTLQNEILYFSLSFELSALWSERVKSLPFQPCVQLGFNFQAKAGWEKLIFCEGNSLISCYCTSHEFVISSVNILWC